MTEDEKQEIIQREFDKTQDFLRKQLNDKIKDGKIMLGLKKESHDKHRVES
ncbi:MAG TPA: hypothetical protein VIK94_00720 [Bacilli bacterium]